MKVQLYRRPSIVCMQCFITFVTWCGLESKQAKEGTYIDKVVSAVV